MASHGMATNSEDAVACFGKQNSGFDFGNGFRDFDGARSRLLVFCHPLGGLVDDMLIDRIIGIQAVLQAAEPIFLLK